MTLETQKEGSKDTVGNSEAKANATSITSTNHAGPGTNSNIMARQQRFERERKEKNFQTKVVIRRLPPSMSEEQFLDQISPVPDYDYMYFVKADPSMGQFAFCRAYINFINQEDIFIFKDKFDGYVFVDSKGNEYPAIVEFAPFQKIPKRRMKKKDAKCGSIEQDPDYLKFLESLQSPEEMSLPSAEAYLEEIEAKERELKANNGVLKLTTPLIEYIKQKKLEKQVREEKREERKRRELERKRQKEEERRRRKAEKEEKVRDRTTEHDESKEKEFTEESDMKSEHVQSSQTVVKLLKNPEREKEREGNTREPEKEESKKTTSSHFRSREVIVSQSGRRDRDKRREWDRQRDRQRPREKEKQPHFRERNREKPRKDLKEDKYNTSGYADKARQRAENLTSRSSGYRSLLSSSSTKDSIKGKSSTSTREDRGAGGKVNSQELPSKSRRNCGESLSADTGVPSKANQDMESSEGRDQKTSKAEADSNKSSSDKSESSSADLKDTSKDPRAERRIRNKDRPSLEIYRPGMRRLNVQRSSPQKEEAGGSSPSSPTPSNSSNRITSGASERFRASRPRKPESVNEYEKPADKSPHPPLESGISSEKETESKID
ncbi:uncharacterized protein LOC143239923 isoform X2 [Tachypleus tridentatus]|uniref:uncharacterized protein LOC143239923 isoform X2 n=1 Tax=Tachypleus tridentatus TaxID=6853 RepID=UPI003FD532B6